jgi:hypothetical protein
MPPLANTEPARLIVSRDDKDPAVRLIAPMRYQPDLGYGMPVPIKASSSFGIALRGLLSEMNYSGCTVTGHLKDPADWLLDELRIATLLRHQLDWTDQAVEVVFTHDLQATSKLITVQYGNHPSLRHIAAVVMHQHADGGEHLHPLSPLVTPQLHYDLFEAGVCAVEPGKHDYVIAADPTFWDAPEFLERVVIRLLHHLEWASDDFTLLYFPPPRTADCG